MNRLGLLAGVALCSIVGCASPSEDTASSDDAVTANEWNNAACTQPYWQWVLGTLEPMMTNPATTDADLESAVAAHPAMGENASTYAICWFPIFSKHVYAPAAMALHDANVKFVDRTNAGFGSLEAYRRNIAMTPQLRRNAKAMLALRPKTMMPTDVGPWSVAYGSVLGETVHALGQPGLLTYEEVVEDEWVFDAEEAEYLAIFERAMAAPSEDGNYGEWFSSFTDWVFGPPLQSTSFVFNLTWEPGAVGGGQWSEGVRTDGGEPYLPPLVKSFVARYAATRPAAVGVYDTNRWMSLYHARGLRALANLPQDQPLLTKTDALALDVIESVKPATLRADKLAYESWADLMQLSAGKADASWTTRFAKAEPCVEPTALAAAQQVHDEKLRTLDVAAPHACAR